jgi:NodT family efflux transporter outer membrane factor (OMF) lipoprotein
MGSDPPCSPVLCWVQLGVVMAAYSHPCRCRALPNRRSLGWKDSIRRVVLLHKLDRSRDHCDPGILVMQMVVLSFQFDEFDRLVRLLGNARPRIGRAKDGFFAGRWGIRPCEAVQSRRILDARGKDADPGQNILDVGRRLHERTRRECMKETKQGAPEKELMALRGRAAVMGGASVFAASLLVSCAVGPNFKSPAPPQDSRYLPTNPPEATATAPVAGGEAQRFVNAQDIPGQWWTLFQSNEMNALLEAALAHNPTLEAAQAALKQANENVAAQRGAFYPSFSGSYQTQRADASLASYGLPGGGNNLYTLNSASVNVAYTLDVFGGIRRQVEALQAQADYERSALEASYLALTANVVTAAVTEASLRAQVAVTEGVAHSQRAQLDITERRVKAGAVSRVDVLQQQATLQATLATVPALRTQLAQERDLLATYVGTLPARYEGGAIQLDALHLPEDLPLSLPSRLVEQRPDVREYSDLLHESTAQVGVATANMLPQFTLTGSYGGSSVKFSDLFSPTSAVWNLAGGITQPLFKGGQLTHQRRAAVAAAQQAAANYRATVLTAFQNVADSLLALQGDAEVLSAQTGADQAAAESLRLVQVQYKAGSANYLQVLTAEQAFQNATLGLVRARAQRFLDTAALFQALGGGWWNRSDANTPVSAVQDAPVSE